MNDAEFAILLDENACLKSELDRLRAWRAASDDAFDAMGRSGRIAQTGLRIARAALQALQSGDEDGIERLADWYAFERGYITEFWWAH